MEAATFSSRKKPPPPPTSSYSNNAVFGGGGGGGLFATSYDDVFGGLPKFAAPSTLAPRAEDYSEIFGAFRTSSARALSSSSIPVLDLPAINAADFDGVFDYSDVFGGLNGVDFAVPFDQLFRSEDGFDASDDEAWTPVGTESLSDDSDPFAFSDKSQSSLNIHQPSEGKQFNVSYHKANPGMSSCVANSMHVTQLNDVSAYTCIVEQAASLREMKNERLCSPLADDIVLSSEVPPVLSVKHTRKTASDLSVGAGSESFDGDCSSGRTHSAIMSHVNSTSASDINFTAKPVQTPPSGQSSVGRNGNPSGLASRPKIYPSCGLEATVDRGLPPFLDMDVDASSSAAASAAAMKDAMEKAQAKLKAAKEFRGRKDSFQNGKVGSKTDVNGGENVAVASNECVFEENQLHSTCDRGTIKTKRSSKIRHGRNLSQIIPDIPAAELPTGVTVQLSETKNDMKCSLSMETAFPEVAGEWKEARQYYEFVNSDNPRLVTQPPNDNVKAAIPKKQDKSDDSSDSAGEACAPEENRRRLKTTKAVSRQEYYEKMVKVALEAHDRVTGEHSETSVGQKGKSQENRKERKPEFVTEREKSKVKVQEAHQAEAIPVEASKKRMAEVKSKIVLENEEINMGETNASCRDQNGGSMNGAHQNMAKEASDIEGGETVRGSFEMKTSERGVNEAMVGEREQRKEEAFERQRNERELAETLTQKNKERREVKDRRSKEAAEDVFCGEGLPVTHEIQDNYKIQDFQQIEAEDERLQKAVEDIFSQDRMPRTFEGVQNDMTRGLQQRYELEEHLEEAFGAQESAKMPDHYVELEKCWEYLEDLEQEKIRLNLSESPEPTFEMKHLAKTLKQHETDEQLEKTAGPKDVWSKSMETGEPEVKGNIIDKIGDNENQNGGCRSQTKTEWEDEGREPDSSSDIELPIYDEHQNLYNGPNLSEEDAQLDVLPFKLNKTLEKVDGSLEASSQGENGESATELETFGRAHVLIDERKTNSAAAQVGAIDDELGRTAAQESHGMLKTKADISMDVSAQKEIGEVRTAPLDESTFEAAETTNGVADELDRSEIHPSHTPHVNADNSKSSGSCHRNEHSQTEKDMKVSQSDTDPMLGKDPIFERGRMRSQGLGQVQCNQAENVRPSKPELINGWNESASRKEAARIVVPDRTENSLKKTQLPHLGQSIGRMGKSNYHDCSLEVKGDEKKKDMEKDHLRKLEEEREREREREKDRMAVEVAIREARERAYSDARDKAERAALERATDEARQRAMSEARERLEKACAEAKERASADKSSEARLRAERAAVERATAEARQRAIEKAMAERATFEARERIQRSVSEKFTSERDVMMRQSSFPSTSDRYEAAVGEPAQRCKARLERHQRTVERVAKALAEKNTRDLLAQREQAERNRFAETLDADIKRWSSGKAGNLRALLSTLQYILGPDSGWQPIPLTEVITAAAVKKAYRKATLCVHPDKLQQRGATVQQKYICEKVFDLLKEAWNRFNSEEK